MFSLVLIVAAFSGVRAFSNCPVLYVEGASVSTGYYTDSGRVWEGRPVYNDRFGNVIYHSNEYWHIGHTKVVESCNSWYVQFRIKDDSLNPVELIGKAFARSCSDTFNYHLKLSCVMVDPGLNCELNTGLTCPNLAHDTALIVDFSYSVDGLEMTEQWCLMERLAKALAPNDPNQRVGLIAFAQSSTQYVPLTTNGTGITASAGGYFTVNSASPIYAGTGINRHNLGGMTGIGEALTDAVSLLTNGIPTAPAGRHLSVVMMTDGTRNAGVAPLTAVLALRDMGVVTQIIGVAPTASKKSQYLREYTQYSGSDDLVDFVTSFEEYAEVRTFEKALGVTCSLHASTCSDLTKTATWHRSGLVSTVLGENLMMTTVGAYTALDASVSVEGTARAVKVRVATRKLRDSWSDATSWKAIPRRVEVDVAGHSSVIFDTATRGTVSVSGASHSGPGSASVGLSGTWTATSKTDCTGRVIMTHTVSYGSGLQVSLEERFFDSTHSVYDISIQYSPICTTGFSVGRGVTHSGSSWLSALVGATSATSSGVWTRRTAAVTASDSLGTTIGASDAGTPADVIGPLAVDSDVFDCTYIAGLLTNAKLAACKTDAIIFGESLAAGKTTSDCAALYSAGSVPGGGYPTDMACSAGCTAPSYCSSGVCVLPCTEHGSSVEGACQCKRSETEGFWTAIEKAGACTHCWRDYHGVATAANEGFEGYYGTHCHEKCKGCASQPDTSLPGAVRADRTTLWGTDAAINTLTTEYNEGTPTRDYVSHTKPVTLKASAGCTEGVTIDITFLRANTFTHSVIGLYNYTNAVERSATVGHTQPTRYDCKPLFWDVHPDSTCLVDRKSRVTTITLQPGTEYALFTLTNGWCADDNGRLGDTAIPTAAPAPLKYTAKAVPFSGDPLFASDPDGSADGLQHFSFLDGDALLNGGTAAGAGTTVGNLIVGVEEHYGLGDADYNDNVYVIEAANGGANAATTCGLVWSVGGDVSRPPTGLRDTFVVNPPSKCLVPTVPTAPVAGLSAVTPYSYWGIIGTIYADGYCFASNDVDISKRAAQVANADGNSAVLSALATEGGFDAEQGYAVTEVSADSKSRAVHVEKSGPLWFTKESSVTSLDDVTFGAHVDAALHNDVDTQGMDAHAEIDGATGTPQLWVVLFYAFWCDAARSVGEQVEALARTLPAGVHVAAVEQTRSPKVFSKYGITKTPAFRAVSTGSDGVHVFNGTNDGGSVHMWVNGLWKEMTSKSPAGHKAKHIINSISNLATDANAGGASVRSGAGGAEGVHSTDSVHATSPHPWVWPIVLAVIAAMVAALVLRARQTAPPVKKTAAPSPVNAASHSVPASAVDLSMSMDDGKRRRRVAAANIFSASSDGTA